MATTVGQYCIYVEDIERSIRFYTEIIGLKLQGRTEIDDVHEAHLAADEGGGRLQLAERYNGGQPIDHGFALWKTYMRVDDCEPPTRRRSTPASSRPWRHSASTGGP